jgi:type IV pilus biogenesis/stability protein PilW
MGAVGGALLILAGCASGGSGSSERNDAQRYLRLAQLRLEQGKTLEAIESTRNAIDLDSGMVEAHNFLGLIYLSTSEFDKAVEELERAVQIDPYFTDARNNLGIAYKKVGQYERAEEEFQSAFRDKNYRSREKIHLNLGHLYLEQGRNREAIEAFRRALEIEPEYLLALIGLGQGYSVVGRADLAEQALRKVVRLAPGSPEAARAQQLLTGQVKQERQ